MYLTFKDFPDLMSKLFFTKKSAINKKPWSVTNRDIDLYQYENIKKVRYNVPRCSDTI